MKKLSCILLALIVALSALGQADSTSIPPYKRFPSHPPFRILLTDSTTWMTKADLPKKKAVMIMIFNPECDHCKHETEEILKHIDEFKKIEIVMATPRDFETMKDFYAHYDLARFQNIHVGRDVSFTLPVFYNIRSLPFLAFYDKKGALIDTFEGSMPIEKVLAKFK